MSLQTNDTSAKKHYKNRNADERQAELHKKFPSDSFLGNEINMDHFIQWVTFFRRNLHRFAIDYLGIKLHLYQIIMLYMMGINNFIVVIASRASAKSFIIALYACCRCILYPNSMIVLSSATKGQSKLLVSEKIQKELMTISPILRKEILRVKDNQNEIIVYFRNHSTITVVPASENGRGYRSNVIVREEFRQIKKSVDDSILSPFQIIRQTPYMKDEFYVNIKDLEEETIDIYISSSWFDNGHWMWEIVDQAYDEMLKGKSSCLLAFDESIAIKHKIKTMRYFQTEKRKQDPLTWRMEFYNERVKENEFAFFTYTMLEQNQRVMRPFYPRTLLDFKNNRKNPYDIPKQSGEIRVVACDLAFVSKAGNDNSVYTCARLIPDYTTYSRQESGEVVMENGYRRIISYIESSKGADVLKQSVRIRQLMTDFSADYLVLDLRNAGVAVYDMVARVLYDEERDVEYTPLSCMNDDIIANRIKIEGSNPCVFVINATQKLNSDIALDFRRVLENKQIEFLPSLEQALEDVLPNIREYANAPDADTQFFYEAPFLETQALINETASLQYERKESTGVIVVKEGAGQHKDRYSSCSYLSNFSSLLEKDLFTNNDDYEYSVFIN